MGIRRSTFQFILDASGYLKKDFSDIRMCELGNQMLRVGSFKREKYFEEFGSKIKNEINKRGVSCKEYCKYLGIKEHISIDLNGKNEALILDLNKPIDKWKNYFDIVTNFGTSEHVRDQHNCFLNMHNFCNVGGVFIDVVPSVGFYILKHNNVVYYKTEFFKELSEKNNYHIIRNENVKMDKSVFLCYMGVKKEDSDFNFVVKNKIKDII